MARPDDRSCGRWRRYTPAARRRVWAKAVTWFALLVDVLWFASCQYSIRAVIGSRYEVSFADGAIRVLVCPFPRDSTDTILYPFQIGDWPIRFSPPAVSLGCFFKPRLWHRGRSDWEALLPLWIPAALLTGVALLLWRSCRVDLSRCPRCGYDLRNLTIPRCPECGLWYVDRTRWVWRDGVSSPRTRANRSRPQHAPPSS